MRETLSPLLYPLVRRAFFRGLAIFPMFARPKPQLPPSSFHHRQLKTLPPLNCNRHSTSAVSTVLTPPTSPAALLQVPQHTSAPSVVHLAATSAPIGQIAYPASLPASYDTIQCLHVLVPTAAGPSGKGRSRTMVSNPQTDPPSFRPQLTALNRAVRIEETPTPLRSEGLGEQHSSF